MSLSVRLRIDDPTPPFEQLRAQIASAIAAGVLPAGSRLPTVRQLAGDLGIATGTVARTYKELEQAGLVTTARRAGTTVTGAAPATPDDPLEELAAQFVQQARRLGRSNSDILAAVQATLAR